MYNSKHALQAKILAVFFLTIIWFYFNEKLRINFFIWQFVSIAKHSKKCFSEQLNQELGKSNKKLEQQAKVKLSFDMINYFILFKLFSFTPLPYYHKLKCVLQ